uniref:Uncharacterized protein n=1 Tax=Arundo donax TaxID=35708 RepID=A0A0A9GP57_ARUDO
MLFIVGLFFSLVIHRYTSNYYLQLYWLSMNS